MRSVQQVKGQQIKINTMSYYIGCYLDLASQGENHCFHIGSGQFLHWFLSSPDRPMQEPLVLTLVFALTWQAKACWPALRNLARSIAHAFLKRFPATLRQDTLPFVATLASPTAYPKKSRGEALKIASKMFPESALLKHSSTMISGALSGTISENSIP